MKNITIHTDGGARGNPGPAASAFVVEEGTEILFKGSKYLGTATNNVAEYKGVILALEWLVGEQSKGTVFNIIFYLDSELVVKQINGVYKVKDENLKILHQQISKVLQSYPSKILFKNIPRSQNKIADGLVNSELDNNI